MACVGLRELEHVAHNEDLDREADMFDWPGASMNEGNSPLGEADGAASWTCYALLA